MIDLHKRHTTIYNKYRMKKLDELYATAISGNNIFSTALYVVSVSVLFAGVFAPFVLLAVAVLLFFYKYIYIEVVESLPVNGGVYTCLLNSTSKIWASIAGVLTFLSYITAGVISAKVAIEYINTVVSVPVFPLTVGLLLVFALIVVSGIKDSAYVALGIFVVHILTLLSFFMIGGVYAVQNSSYFMENLMHTRELIDQRGILMTIVLAFSASLLSVTGFESSANFVEEQRKGVFRKTLRNMLIGALIFNPLIAVIVLNIMPAADIINAQDFLLAEAAEVVGGKWYTYVVVCDAFLVLSGAVLTSYIGVGGLVSRMSLDNCLPAFLSKKNAKGSYPYIVACFFIISVSILFLTNGNLLLLAGVYTLSFLSVMSLYAVGNIILKLTRQDLKRTLRAPKTYVLLGFLGTALGLVGNTIIEPKNVGYFILYVVPCGAVVMLMIYKSDIIRGLMRLTRNRLPGVHNLLYRYFANIIEGRFVAFIQCPERVYQTLDYINKNENGRNITLVFCRKEEHDKAKESRDEYKEIKELLPHLKKAGVFPHLAIKLLYHAEPFSPKTVRAVAKELKIERNRVLIGSLHDSHRFKFDNFGGVRIIF